MTNFLSKSGWSENIAAVSFLMLYPVFFAYNYLVGSGIISAFLGGYFGIVSVVSLFALSVGLRLNKFRDVPASTVFFLIASAHSALVACLNFVVDRPIFVSYEMLKWTFTGLLFACVGFLLGFELRLRGWLEPVVYFFCFSMALVCALNINEYGALAFRSEVAREEGALSSHQGLARSILLTYLVAVAFASQRGAPIMLTLIIFGMVSLFIAGARTELVVFLVSVGVATAARVGLSIGLLIWLTVLPALLLTGVSTLSIVVPESRILELFNLVESTSFLARQFLQQSAIESISSNPLLGDYGGYTSSLGLGGYPHSILSAWVNGGLIGFMLYVAVLVFLFKDLFLTTVRESFLAGDFLHFALVSAALIGVIFSKNQFYEVLAISVGFAASWRRTTVFPS